MREKFADLVKLSKEELTAMLQLARERALELRFKAGARELKAWQEIKTVKVRISRILTLLRTVHKK